MMLEKVKWNEYGHGKINGWLKKLYLKFGTVQADVLEKY